MSETFTCKPKIGSNMFIHHFARKVRRNLKPTLVKHFQVFLSALEDEKIQFLPIEQRKVHMIAKNEVN